MHRFHPTALPSHSKYSEDTASGTCTVTLVDGTAQAFIMYMDGTEQTFTLEEAFPYGTVMFDGLRWEIREWYGMDKETLEWYRSLPGLEDKYRRTEATLAGDFSQW